MIIMHIVKIICAVMLSHYMLIVIYKLDKPYLLSTGQIKKLDIQFFYPLNKNIQYIRYTLCTL